MRFVTPALFAAAAAWVYWNNTTNATRILVLPFLDVLFPSIAQDPVAQGRMTVVILVGLAIVFTLWDGLVLLRRRRPRPDE